MQEKQQKQMAAEEGRQTSAKQAKQHQTSTNSGAAKTQKRARASEAALNKEDQPKQNATKAGQMFQDLLPVPALHMSQEQATQEEFQTGAGRLQQSCSAQLATHGVTDKPALPTTENKTSELALWAGWSKYRTGEFVRPKHLPTPQELYAKAAASSQNETAQLPWPGWNKYKKEARFAHKETMAHDKAWCCASNCHSKF